MSFIIGPIFNSQNSKVREWSISINLFDGNNKQVDIGDNINDIEINDGYYSSYSTCSGYDGMKMTISASTIIRVGKNIGKKNETNVLTQAYKECLSKYASKIKAGYSETISNDSKIGFAFPMAVKSWKDHKSKLEYPLFIQPKLDGVRMIAKYDGNDVKLITRRLHDIIGFNKIKKDLKSMFDKSGLKDFYIDGELYSHGTNLQTISGIVRNESIDEKVKDSLQYYIFDCFDINQLTIGFETRFDILKKFIETTETKIIILNDTILVESPSKADDYYKKVVADGYEGVIYKSLSRPYEFDFNKEKRSAWYLKRKKQDDGEYPIIGFTEGKGKDLACIVFELQGPNEKTFNCVPNGTYDYRKELYVQAMVSFDSTFKGKLAKVVFDDLSKDGIPLRGRIVQIGRDLSFD